MYNHLILSALIVMVFEPSKILSRIMCISKGEYWRVFRRWYSSFSCFQISSFSVEQMQENEEKITKKGFSVRVFSAETGIF